MAHPPLPPAILFDLDDTLIDAYARPDLAWARVAGEFAGALAPHPAEAVAASILDYARRFWAGLPREAHPVHLGEARRRIVEGALNQAGLLGHGGLSPALARTMADRFTALRDEEMKLFPGALETVDALKAHGLKLALVTNGTGPEQRAKVVRFGLEHRFDHIQIQGEHGFGKPEERAYTHAMERLGVTAPDCWMVGDHLEWEVAAPQRLGIYAVWHDPFGQGLPKESDVRPDRIIRSLTELLE